MKIRANGVDLEAVQRFMSSPVLFAIFDMPWAPFFILLIYAFHPWLGHLAVIGMIALETVAHKAVGKLSKGYRQRVSMAAALLHDPDVLIMDEPTSGLDPNQIRGVRALIRELGKSKTVLVSTHILQEVEPVADRVLFIHDGKIVFDGKPAELAKQNGNLEEAFYKLTAQPV